MWAGMSKQLHEHNPKHIIAMQLKNILRVHKDETMHSYITLSVTGNIICAKQDNAALWACGRYLSQSWCRRVTAWRRRRYSECCRALETWRNSTSNWNTLVQTATLPDWSNKHVWLCTLVCSTSAASYMSYVAQYFTECMCWTKYT